MILVKFKLSYDEKYILVRTGDQILVYDVDNLNEIRVKTNEGNMNTEFDYIGKIKRSFIFSRDILIHYSDNQISAIEKVSNPL